MTRLYVLDTNTASHIIKGNVPRVRERLVRIPINRVAISVVTEAELRFAVGKKPEAQKLRAAVEEFLLNLNILSWDSGAAKAYATVRFAMERLGKPMGSLDIMIAAQALAVRGILVTSDRVFQSVSNLDVEDWAK